MSTFAPPEPDAVLFETGSVSLILLSTGSAESAMNALRSATAAVGQHRCDGITVLAPLASPAARAIRNLDDRGTRLYEMPQGFDAAQAWAAGLGTAAGDWLLLFSDDIRINNLDLGSMLSSPNGSANVITPLIESGAGKGRPSQSLSADNGVCLAITRVGLETDTLMAPQLCQEWNVETWRTADGVWDEVGEQPGSQTPAPGGGAPPGPTLFIGNTYFWGASIGDQARRLHLGSGPFRIPGWTNIDGDAACHPDAVLDLRDSLPHDDNSVDLVYSEHLFEHLPLQEGVRLMREVHRVLTPGGVMRVAMPDLATLVEHYQQGWRSQSWLAGYEAIDSAAHMLNYAVREWGHVYMYDYPELELRLRQSGFTEIKSCVNGQSENRALQGLEQRPESVLVVEATKR